MQIQPVNSTKQYSPAKKAAKTVAATAATAAVTAGTILFLAKKGKLNPVEGGNKYLEGLKAVLKKPADKVNTVLANGATKLSQTKVGKKAGEMVSVVKGKIENLNLGKKAETARKAITESAPYKAVKGAAGKVKEFITSIPKKVSSFVGGLKEKFSKEAVVEKVQQYEENL